jgi:hypothetical protein
MALAAFAVALALGGVFLSSGGQRAEGGDVIAAEPRVVTIGAQVVAEMSSGAHIYWSGEYWSREYWSRERGPDEHGSGIEVQQGRGAVTYRVAPGARLRVQTEHGSVAALGTVFRVVVAERDETGEEAMKKRWAIAGAGAALGALLFVSVEQGSVRLSKGDNELMLSAGQSGSIGSDGIPRLATDAPGAARAPAGPAASAGGEPANPPRRGARLAAPEAERLRRRVLDSLRARPPANAAENDSSRPAAKRYGPGTMVDRTGELGEESMRVLNHEFIPLVFECYDQARERNPQLRGMLAVNLELAGAEEVGSIVETVQPAQDRNQVDDEELIECVRQSAFSIQLPMPATSGRTGRQLTIPLGDPLPADAGR